MVASCFGAGLHAPRYYDYFYNRLVTLPMHDALLFILLSFMISYRTEGEVGSVLHSVLGHVSVVVLKASMSNVIPMLSLSHDCEDAASVMDSEEVLNVKKQPLVRSHLCSRRTQCNFCY